MQSSKISSSQKQPDEANAKWIQSLPKVELHRHLELSIRHSTLRELAPKFGFDLSPKEAFGHHFLIEEPMTDLGAVLHKFLDTQKLLATEEILERIAFEACEDAFAEGIRILELRYAPTFVVQGHPELTFEKTHQAICKGVIRAETKFPMAVGLVCIIQRILPVKEAEAVTQFAIEHKDTFVGLDLADNEVGFDSKPFSKFFLQAKAAGLGITVHSGEANVPKAPQYVRDAIEHLGAERIGHGVQIYRDPEMINFVKDHKVVLELCPSSNWLTQAVTSLKAHPIRMLMEAGVLVTINTDDPGIFNTDMNKEYSALAKHHGFNEKEFRALNQIAATSSFISEEKKKKVWS